jgi:hypothetical protein
MEKGFWMRLHHPKWHALQSSRRRPHAVEGLDSGKLLVDIRPLHG